MRFTHDGLALWYGTEDAYAPTSGEMLSDLGAITIGVHPAHPSNKVTVRYRVDGGRVQTLSAVLAHTDYGEAKQYFRAAFSGLTTASKIEYLPLLTCGGRQVPDVVTSSTFPSCFLYDPPQKVRICRGPITLSSPEEPSYERFPFSLEYLGTAIVHLNSAPEIIGETPEGLKVDWYVTGGTITGPKFNARIRPEGGDWMTLRPDGIGDINVRATLETYDGALIYVDYTGVFEFGEEGYRNFLKRKWPASPTLRTAPRFITAHPKYSWLNRLQCLGIGMVNMAKFQVLYDLYAIR